MLRLTDLSDDDKAIAGTMLDHNLGKRYHEASRRLNNLYQEIQKARGWPRSNEGQAEHFFQKHQKMVQRQWEAAWPVLPLTTLKILHGYQVVAGKYGGGVFPAPLAEVAIQAGVGEKTAIRHRDKLVAGGWLVEVWKSNGGGQASTYRLRIPTSEELQARGATCVHPTPQVLGGTVHVSQATEWSSGRRFSRSVSGRINSASGESQPGQKSAHPPIAKKSPHTGSPLVDLSGDSARWNTTQTLWGVLPYVTEETTSKALATDMGVSVRTVERYTKKLFEFGLISDRQHPKLVDNWRDIWESLAEKKKTAGKKQAAVKKLERERVARRRLRLVRAGQAVQRDDGTVTLVESGEIL
jgi:hypothetical protein